VTSELEQTLENARKAIRTAAYLVAEHGMFRAAGMEWEANPAAVDDAINYLSSSSEAARAVIDELIRRPNMLRSMLMLAMEQK
jgi:hypothetical protein